MPELRSDLLPAAELFDALQAGRFDSVIDVRSPAEFAEDHLPGAINLPVLDNEERATVGTIYVQKSKFQARKIGAALVSRNIALHLETALAEKEGGWRPLVMCWRGGQRSGAMALVLRQVGWRALSLEGGYRSYRRAVSEALYGEQLGLDAVLIAGGTGSGKTALLKTLAARGRAVIDLEGLAAHRGSLFGAEPGRKQPSQKMFESRLFAALPSDASEPTLLEAEASRIGDVTVPKGLWADMCAAPLIQLNASVEARAAHIIEDYGDIAEDRAALDALLLRLPHRHSNDRIAEWRRQAAAGELRALVEGLIAEHYDPAYAKPLRQRPREVLAQITMDRIDAPALEQAADQVETALDAYAAERAVIKPASAPSTAPAAPPSRG